MVHSARGCFEPLKKYKDFYFQKGITFERINISLVSISGSQIFIATRPHFIKIEKYKFWLSGTILYLFLRIWDNWFHPLVTYMRCKGLFFKSWKYKIFFLTAPKIVKMWAVMSLLDFVLMIESIKGRVLPSASISSSDWAKIAFLLLISWKWEVIFLKKIWNFKKFKN